MTATANKRTEMTTTTMTTSTTTTTMTTTPECGGGLPRFITEEAYEETFSNTAVGTPRPGMNAADMTERQDAANQAILTFSQVAKHAAAASKRRRSPKSRTDYSLMNKHVVRAFNDLEAQMKQHSAIMSEADFKLLKHALANFRVKLIVHDNMSLEQLKALQAKTTEDIIAAQAAIHAAYIDNTSPDSEQKYLDAKDRAADLNTWHTDLAKEIQRVEPSQNKGIGLSRSANTSAAAPLGVPSQHAHIAPATGVHFRNILSPETIRRTFISLEALTKKIRDELVLFLINTHRHKDRHEVIKQIKASIMAAKAAKK